MVFNENDKKRKPLIILAMEDCTKQRLLDEKLREYTKELEQKVAQRTTDLEQRLMAGSKSLDARMAELEKINSLMVGRELAIIELKERIRDLEDKLDRATKFFVGQS